jgi:hypothetical protein
MTVTIKDGLHTFGTQELVEIPNDLINSGGGITKTNDAVQKAPLGILFRYKGNVYRYVQHDDGTAAVATAAGGVARWKTLDPANGKFIVTSDCTDEIGLNLIAGIYGYVVTDQYYTWIQVGGVVSAFVANSTVAGDVCIDGTTDLYFDRIAADASIIYKPFGVALESKSATITNQALVLLLGMIW